MTWRYRTTETARENTQTYADLRRPTAHIAETLRSNPRISWLAIDALPLDPRFFAPHGLNIGR
jgi:hypothetical protein